MSRRALFRPGHVLAAAVIAIGMLGTPAISLAADNMAPDLLQRLRAQTDSGKTPRIIVKYRWNTERAYRLRERLSPSQRRARTARRAQLTTMRARLMNRLDPGSRRVRTYRVLPFDALRVTDDGLDALLDDPGVESIYLDRYYRTTLANSTPMIGADDAHNSGFTGAGQTVVIADTGVRASHDFFKDGQGNSRVVHQACFSTNDPPFVASFCPNGQEIQIGGDAARHCSVFISGCEHGTHVAGIAAGSATHASVGFNGVAPDATIIAVQVFSRISHSPTCASFGLSTPCPLVLTSDLIAASDYLIANVNTTLAQYNIAAVNLSLGAAPETTPCDSDPGKSNVDSLHALGIATVVAAGNGSSRTQLSSPACISTAVSVGNTTDFDLVRFDSNVSTHLDLFAPGDSVTSSVSFSNVSFTSLSGTSMSAPHVTGAFAVMRQANPNATVTEMLNALKNTGVPIDDTRSGGSVQNIPRIQLDQALLEFGGPDLVVEWGKLKPGCLVSESVCRIKGEIFVQNRGLFPAGQSQLGIYYSPDSTLNRATDTQVVQATVGGLSPNQFVRMKVKLPLPGVTDITGGSVFGFADDGETVGESDETNNDDRVAFAGASVQTLIPQGSGTPIGSMTNLGGLASAFDGDKTKAYRVNEPAAGPHATTSFIGKDWGSGVTKTVTGIKLWGAIDEGVKDTVTSNMTITLQGSTDNFSSSIVDLGSWSFPDPDDDTEQNQLSGFTTTTAYRYHRIRMVSDNGARRNLVAELEFYEGS